MCLLKCKQAPHPVPFSHAWVRLLPPGKWNKLIELPGKWGWSKYPNAPPPRTFQKSIKDLSGTLKRHYDFKTTCANPGLHQRPAKQKRKSVADLWHQGWDRNAVFFSAYCFLLCDQVFCCGVVHQANSRHTCRITGKSNWSQNNGRNPFHDPFPVFRTPFQFFPHPGSVVARFHNCRMCCSTNSHCGTMAVSDDWWLLHIRNYPSP